MILQRMPGRPATDHPKRLEILREAARAAATRIHRIRTIGFGFDFSLEGTRCGTGEPTWRGWLDRILEADQRLAFLREHRIISDRQFALLQETLKTVKEYTDPPVLNHGDLRLKNLLVDDAGKILGLLDWEGCISAVGPHWDLSIALHDLGVDEKEAFLDGYGLSSDEVLRLVPVWRLFNALNYFPAIRRRVRSDRTALERIRNRYRGALDLYAVGD
jgi:hygromycin-B 4-O-kinase